MGQNLETSTNLDWSTILYKASLKMKTIGQKRDCLERADKLQADHDMASDTIKLANLAFYAGRLVR
jgi:hypothetical protein